MLADGGPAPCALLALTEQLYAEPLLRPLTVIGLDAPAPVRVAPAPVQLAAYPVMGDPPSDAGAANARLTLPLPGVATSAVGAPGTVAAEGVPPVEVLPPPAEALLPPPQAATAATRINVESRVIRVFMNASGDA
jgi:hypothetical protein